MSVSAIRWATAAAVLATAPAASLVAARSILPRDGSVARGVKLDGAPVEGGAREFARARATAILARHVRLTFEGETLLDATLADLGATVDDAHAASAMEAVAREGDLFARIDDALAARRGEIDVSLAAHVPVEALAARLERAKEERDKAPIAARYSMERHAASAHVDGKYLDLYAAAATIERAATSARDDDAIEAPVFAWAPRASTEAVATIDVDQVVSTFTTHFGYLGGQSNRAKNVARAASEMDGVVLMPGDVVSFNANVGPRTEENGFFVAPEIYKGELREGVGGGTCQVAGTLHAAAYLGGVEIVERANHSRPSGYIAMGLDATVVYPTTDLKLENTYGFPIVVHAIVEPGTLTFELRGRERPATVTYATEQLGTKDFERKVEEAPYLAEGKFKLKQKGIKGYSIKKTRVITFRDGRTKTEVTNDTYPPTFEIWQIGPNTNPDDVLPPFNGEKTEVPAKNVG